MGEDLLRSLRALRAHCDAQLRELVRRSVASGAPTQQIADAIGISRATLWRRYRDDLRQSRTPR